MNGRWVVWMIFGILGMSVIANVIMIRYAVADPSFAIEPRYYDEALAWDARMQQERANGALGWTVKPRLDRSVAGAASLVVELRDAAGAVLSDAVLRVEASPNVCARQRTRATLTWDGSAYTGDVGGPCEGLWRLDIVASRGDDVFAARQVAELTSRP